MLPAEFDRADVIKTAATDGGEPWHVTEFEARYTTWGESVEIDARGAVLNESMRKTLARHDAALNALFDGDAGAGQVVTRTEDFLTTINKQLFEIKKVRALMLVSRGVVHWRGQSASIKDGLTGVHSDVAAEVIAAVYENYGATLPEKTEEQSGPPPATPSGRKRRSGANTNKTSETRAG